MTVEDEAAERAWWFKSSGSGVGKLAGMTASLLSKLCDRSGCTYLLCTLFFFVPAQRE